MNKKRFSERLTIFFALSVLLVISFYDVVFLNKTFKATTANPQTLTSGPFGQENNRPAFFPVMSTDTPILEEPFYEFIKNAFRQGIIPFWNPYQACGYPFIAMIEFGMFFPLNLLYYALPSEIGWDMVILARFLIAGLLTYYFMRTLRYKRIPALAAAVAFMLSGPMVLLQYNFANVEILVPLLLIAMEHLLRRPGLRQSALTSLAIALTFFAGHPEHILFANGFAFFYFCFRLFTIKPAPDKKNAFFFLLFSYLLCIALAGPVLFPFLRNMPELWHNHPPHMGLRSDGEPGRFISVLLPYFFQKEPVQLDFSRTNWWGGYIGVLPLVLAFFSLFTKQRRGLNYFFFLLAFLNISKSYFGFPFINWIGHLPIIKDLRFFVHTSHLLAFSLAVCAGMGVRAAIDLKRTSGRGLWFSLPLAIIIILHLFKLKTTDHFDISLHAGIFAVGILAVLQIILFLQDKKIGFKKMAGSLLLALLCLELFYYIPRGRANRLNSFPPVPYIELLERIPERSRSYGTHWTFYPNTASGYQSDDLGFASGLLPIRYVNFVNNFLIPDYFEKNLRRSALWVTPVTTIPEARPFLDLLNQRFTIVPRNFNTGNTLDILNQIAAPIYNAEVLVYVHPPAFPRAFIVHRAVFEPDPQAAAEKLKNLRNNLRQVIVIEHPDIPEIRQQLSAAPDTDNSRAQIKTYSLNEVVVEANLENPGFLVLSDSYHDDWKIFVNGEESRIFLTDTLIRSVFLPAGQHTVKFVFRPGSFYAGVGTCGLALIFVLIVLIQTHRNKYIKSRLDGLRLRVK